MIDVHAIIAFGEDRSVEYGIETDVAYNPDAADDLRQRVSIGLADALTVAHRYLIEADATPADGD